MTKLSIPSRLLILAGLIAAGTAIWHWLCIIGGLSWYAFAHAPPSVLESVRQGTLLAPISATVLGFLFMACTVFAFSAAGLFRTMPLLKSALATIALLSQVRGSIGIAQVLGAAQLDTWELVASPVWFFCGVCFLLSFLETMKSAKHRV